MNLRLERTVLDPAFTLGRLYVDGLFECWTLEDVVRPLGQKVKGETAIPFGSYELVIDMSERFGRLMPHILNVPDFSGVRIHSGNTVNDTEGCVLVGCDNLVNKVGRSREAFAALLPKLMRAWVQHDPMRIDIVPETVTSPLPVPPEVA